MNRLSFKTPEVAQLYDEVRELCHPEYPFLDPNYSPGSCAPAVDFTPSVAEWIASGKEDAVAELWGFLSHQGDSSAYALRKSLRAHVPHWLKLSETARRAFKAIYLLTIRAGMILPQDISGVSVCLAATTLGCRQLAIDHSCIGELLKATRSEMDENSLIGSVYGKAEGARLAVEKALSPLGAAEAAAEKLKMVPPMARAVVSDYFQRDWGCGKLRFDLYYDHRMYECSSKWNQHYVGWLSFFGPPTDSADVPSGVTKDILREALVQQGIPSAKAATRKAMIEQARCVPGLLSTLILRIYPEQQELRPEWSESVKEWAHRVRYVEPVAAAIMKLLGVSAIKGT